MDKKSGENAALGDTSSRANIAFDKATSKILGNKVAKPIKIKRKRDC